MRAIPPVKGSPSSTPGQALTSGGSITTTTFARPGSRCVGRPPICLCEVGGFAQRGGRVNCVAAAPVTGTVWVMQAPAVVSVSWWSRKLVGSSR